MININKNFIIAASLLANLSLVLNVSWAEPLEGKSDNAPDWFYPVWAAEAINNKPIVVRDTDSALGRYSLQTKEIGLKELSRIHGHLCDGLVIAFIEISAVLKRLFPDGVVDRTDLRAVSKNGPCWVDAVGFLTGARINFQTLRVDNSIGDGFIIQRISTGDAYEVHLKHGVFPKSLANLEEEIAGLRSQGKPVSKEVIDKYEEMSLDLSKRILNTSPEKILRITPKLGYHFIFNDLCGSRRDIINKDMPR